MFVPLSWLIQYFVRFCLLIVPPIFLWSGVAPLYFTSTLDIVYYQLPVLLAYAFLMRWITPTRYLPLLSTAVGAFSTFRLLPTVIATLIKPFGTPFKVTPKGSGAEQDEFDAYTFTCCATLVALTAIGIIINLVPEWSTIVKGEFSIVAMYWAAANIVVLVIAALICFERPRPPVDSFSIGEPARMQFGERLLTGRLFSLSLQSGALELPQDVPIGIGDEVMIEAAGFPRLPCRVEKISTPREGRVSIIRFEHSLDPAERDRLIVKLYTGGYSQEIRQLDTPAILSGLWTRAFGRVSTNA
jgi:cellulose synthase (UDP-forming)